jgi:hypothetical protein
LCCNCKLTIVPDKEDYGTARVMKARMVFPETCPSSVISL